MRQRVSVIPKNRRLGGGFVGPKEIFRGSSGGLFFVRSFGGIGRRGFSKNLMETHQNLCLDSAILKEGVQVRDNLAACSTPALRPSCIKCLDALCLKLLVPERDSRIRNAIVTGGLGPRHLPRLNGQSYLYFFLRSPRTPPSHRLLKLVIVYPVNTTVTLSDSIIPRAS